MTAAKGALPPLMRPLALELAPPASDAAGYITGANLTVSGGIGVHADT